MDNRVVKAKEFVKRWQGRGNEKQDTQQFWREFFFDVLDIKEDYGFVEFEKPVRVDGFYNGPKLKLKVIDGQEQLPIKNKPSRNPSSVKWIDAYVKSASTLIEQKSYGVDLDKPIAQGDGLLLTPIEQAKRYNDNLLHDDSARFIVTCNFDEFRLYDLNSNKKLWLEDYVSIKLDELPNNLSTFDFFKNQHNETLRKEKALSNDAVLKLQKLHDVLIKEYELHNLDKNDLTKLLIRILFCLFAEDIEMFKKDQFLEFLKPKKWGKEEPELRNSLMNLFRTLNTPLENRDKYLDPKLNAFPYVNGNLFKGDIDIPFFTLNSRGILLEDCSQNLHWAKINPTIFGSLFESMIDSAERHERGMHYTSIENIQKVTRPLFLDELEQEILRASDDIDELQLLQNKIANLKIFDPACGSGNFLTQTYIDLRKLENKILDKLCGEGDDRKLNKSLRPRVSVNQFFGIEINDFACEVAKTAIQIAKCQMDIETSALLHIEIDSFPLETAAHIHCANALTTDWNEICPASECVYIIGNPPFLGARMQGEEKKHELKVIYEDSKNCGSIDYVAGWFAKAIKYMQLNKDIHTAFVATNSICQGEQVANVWKPLIDAGISIDFAHNTFRWVNEGMEQAHVFCVIVGFSFDNKTNKQLFYHKSPDSEAEVKCAGMINPYLLDAPNVFIFNSSKPLCNVPKMGIGSQPIDNGNYIFTREEMQEFLQKEPLARKHFHPWVGSKELLNGNQRFILWLGDVKPTEINSLPLCQERMLKVREFRESSNRKQTKRAAETPHHFGTEIISDTTSIIFPRVSSERRNYIPIEFVTPNTFCSDAALLIPNAHLYHFGILHSQTHNAWMRVVCGRLKSDYRYSAGIVYNNFPWPGVTKETLDVPVEECVPVKIREKIKKCAQAVLDARQFYIKQAENEGKTCCLADLYGADEDFIYDELSSAHRELNKAVEDAYSFESNGDEEKIVAHLFKLYQELTAE